MFEKYEDIVSVEDLVSMLQIGKSTAYKLLQDGTIPSLRIGKVYKVPKRAVEQYVLQNTFPILISPSKLSNINRLSS